MLVGEGVPTRPLGCRGREAKISRFVPEAPVYDVIVGEADGQVQLRKPPSHLAKLPRNLRPAEVREVNNRLRAAAAAAARAQGRSRATRMPKMPRLPTR